MKKIKSFFIRTFIWLICGKLLGKGWSGEPCPACGRVHTIGVLGSWRYPKK